MAQICNESAVNLETIVTKKVVKSKRIRIRKLRKKRRANKRKNNLYFKRKKLIRALLVQKRIQKMNNDEDSSSLVSKSDTVWQQVDEVAFWKARALSLEYENKMLHKHIKQMYMNQINYYHHATATNEAQGNEVEDVHENYEEDQYEKDTLEEEDEDDENFNLETKLFRIERDKERARLVKEEMYEDEDESKAPTGHQASKKREEDMQKLYGSSWRRIMGMETAVQLNYDLSVTKCKLKHWPVVPINL